MFGKFRDIHGANPTCQITKGALEDLFPLERRPNIVLIVLDTVRADRLSCYGYGRKTTPNLDRIASEGVLYEQAISPAIWTLPSHVSLFTGLFPSKHGAHRAHQILDTPYVTLAELLGRNGYRSAAFFHPDWLGEVTGATRGFQEIYGRSAWEGHSAEGMPPHAMSDKGSLKIASRATDWVRKTKNEGPFFLFVNLFEAHNPYDPPEPFRSRFLTPEVIHRMPEMNRNITKHYTGQEQMGPEDFSIMGDLYDGEIAYLDEILGNLVEFMRQEGVLDETLLIITSDHGENIGDHGHWGHRYCLYETLLRIPLVIRLPGVFEKGARPVLSVQTVDLYPTIMDLLRLDEEGIRGELQGESLIPSALLSRKRPFSVSEMMPMPGLRSYEGHPGFDASVFSYGLRAIRQGGHKLIWSSEGKHEHYHLSWDPHELRNIFHARSEKAEELRTLLEEWEKSSEAASTPAYSIQKDTGVDDEIRSRLKHLGYLE